MVTLAARAKNSAYLLDENPQTWLSIQYRSVYLSNANFRRLSTVSEGVGISSYLWDSCLRHMYSTKYASFQSSKERHRVLNLSVSTTPRSSRRLTTLRHSRMNLAMSELQVVMYYGRFFYWSCKYLVVCLLLTI